MYGSYNVCALSYFLIHHHIGIFPFCFFSGCLDWEEFRTLMRQTFDEGPGVRVSTKKLIKTAMLTALTGDDAGGGEPTEKQILHMFQLIDQNGDGMLSVSELQLFFKKFNLTSAQISGFIANVGGSGDDLDFEGFKLLCRAVFRGDARAS
jgi:Ca2+-binding EF-hand superfamily protein